MLIDKIKEKLIKENEVNLKKKIVLPESSDIRVLKAGIMAANENIVNIIFIGNKKETINNIVSNNIVNEDELNKLLLKGDLEIIEPKEIYNGVNFAQKLYEIRNGKISLEEAKKLVLDEVYFGMIFVKLGNADGLVSGAIHSTADTLRPALQIIKMKENVKIVSTFFLMEVLNSNLNNDIYIFSDCALVENPSSIELAEIAKMSKQSFENIVGKEAYVAMLSYSSRRKCEIWNGR